MIDSSGSTADSRPVDRGRDGGLVAIPHASGQVACAVLDRAGFILDLNRTWHDAASDHDGALALVGEGSDYRRACEAVTGELAAMGRTLAEALGEVIEGRRDDFTLEYSAPGAGGCRWFLGRVTRLAGEHRARVMVCHEDVTEQRLVDVELHRHDADLSTLAQIFARTPNGVVITDATGRVEWVNDAFTRISGYSLPEVVGRTPGSVLQGPETDAATVALMGQRAPCLRGLRGRGRQLRQVGAEILGFARRPAAPRCVGRDQALLRGADGYHRAEGRGGSPGGPARGDPGDGRGRDTRRSDPAAPEGDRRSPRHERGRLLAGRLRYVCSAFAQRLADRRWAGAWSPFRTETVHLPDGRGPARSDLGRLPPAQGLRPRRDRLLDEGAGVCDGRTRRGGLPGCVHVGHARRDDVPEPVGPGPGRNARRPAGVTWPADRHVLREAASRAGPARRRVALESDARIGR